MQVKADPDSASMRRLEAASRAVRKATDNLVAAATQALEREEDINVEMNTSAVNSVVEVCGFKKKLRSTFAFVITLNLFPKRKSTPVLRCFEWSANLNTPEAGWRSSTRGDTRQTRRRNSRGEFLKPICVHAFWVL